MTYSSNGMENNIFLSVTQEVELWKDGVIRRPLFSVFEWMFSLLFSVFVQAIMLNSYNAAENEKQLSCWET